MKRANWPAPTDAFALSMAAGHRCDSMTSASGMQNTRENNEMRTKRLIPPTSCHGKHQVSTHQTSTGTKRAINLSHAAVSASSSPGILP